MMENAWQRILILAPNTKDALATSKILQTAELNPLICKTLDEVIREMEAGAGAVVLAKEALTQDSVATFSASLASQPKWSSMPIILLISYDELNQGNEKTLKLLEPLRSTTLLERPVRTRTFLSVVKSALADRNRQCEMKNLLEELEQSRQGLDSFAAVAAHDLKSPLNSITQFTELLVEDYGDKLGSDAAEYTDFIISAGKRMSRLIDSLLVYARSGAKFEPKPVDLEEVSHDVIKNLNAQLRSTSTRLTFHSKLPTVLGDEVRMSQLLQNLIANSIKFQKPGAVPQIDISCREDEGSWLFELKDNGIGMAQEQSRSVFEVFKKLNTDAEYEGSGIGLSVCKKIVEGHGGKIWLESIRGEGTRFFFTLPKLV